MYILKANYTIDKKRLKSSTKSVELFIFVTYPQIGGILKYYRKGL